MQDIQPFVDKIIGYGNLQENWDGYGAYKISQKTIQQTLEYLHLVDELPDEVAPVASGEISVMFSGVIYEIDVTVDQDGMCEFLIARDAPEAVYFYDEGFAPVKEMANIAKRWFHERDRTITPRTHFPFAKDSSGN
jgi:hypothetical protein